MHLFITGTGTGVGKTIITAGLAAALRRQGQSVCVYKPIQTGSPDSAQPEDPTQIEAWLSDDFPTACTYCFPEPVGPYMADHQREIQPERILADFQQLQQQYQTVLTEGAGGVRVPIAPQFEMRDLMQLLQCPALVVASPWLGTINHTLLTVEALQHAKITVKGVVISGMPGPESDAAKDPAVQGLTDTLKAFLPVPLLGTIPTFNPSPKGFQQPEIQGHFDHLLTALSA